VRQLYPRWKVTVSITSSATRQVVSSAQHHTGRGYCVDALRGDLFGPDPDDVRSDELQVGYQAGGQVHGADLGSITELQQGSDQNVGSFVPLALWRHEKTAIPRLAVRQPAGGAKRSGMVCRRIY
jgi:hypothetical protein